MKQKTLHDAAFDIAYSQLSGTYNFDNADSIENYVEMARPFQFVDFFYLEQLFSAGGFVDFLKKTEREKIAQQAQSETDSLSREQRRKIGSVLKREIQNAAAQNDKQYDDIVDIMRAIKMIIPYEKMLISQDGYLIPLEETYFRDNPRTIGFKYGGSITCFGYVTNILEKASDDGKGDIDIFSAFQSIVNEILHILLPNENYKLTIIHPIAVYYESE